MNMSNINKLHKLPNRPTCPTCKAPLDGFTSVSDPDSSPRPGCLTICIYCETTLEFTPDMELRIMEVDKLDFDIIRELHRACQVMQSRLGAYGL